MREDDFTCGEGKLLGDYNLLRRLGETSWSINVLAEHRFIKKRFVLQILLPELSSMPDFIRSFEEVVVKLAVLDHPGIAKIQNVSSYDGHFFLVTEDFNQGDSALPGITLSQYILGKHEGLSESEVGSIALKIADALDYAHGRGVIHTCLHPDSVFVCFRSGEPRIIIPDFCLGALTLGRSLRSIINPEEDFSSNNATLVALSQRLSFLAPEIRRGLEGDSRSDSYSFGALVYYLLYKEPPEGVLSDIKDCVPEGRFDWIKILSSCLKTKASERAGKLTDLFLTKNQEEDLPESSDILDTTLIPRTPELRAPCQGIEEVRLSEKFCVSETVTNVVSSPFVPEPEPEFLLVTAKSIDEEMETKVTSVATRTTGSSAPVEEEQQEIPSDNYTAALQAMFNRDPVVSRYRCAAVSEKKIEPILSETAYIQGGEFFRGSQTGKRDEQPVGRIVLDAFLMDIHPVTNQQFLKFLEFSRGEQDKHYNDLIRLKESRIQRRSGKLFIETGYDRHPVVGVTWYGAYGYAAWVGRRLPTEAEWEIAAKGGKDIIFPCGNVIDKHEANFFSSDTTPVMSYQPNNYGLYDMAGNVYEWCHDWYGYDYYEVSASEPYSPQGPPQGVYRVLRGGCWKSLKEDLRCAHRHRNNPGTVNSTYGFRCVVDIG